jgi:filamentous hemagglutinin family protein
MNILKIIFRVSFSFSALLVLMGGRCSMVVAQIVPDNSLASNTSKLSSPTGKDLVIQGGLAQGNNLFHSFSEFNVNPGQKVYFQGISGIDHTIARVTGNKISNIAGSLGAGSSNLYLVNPNGIIFSGEVDLKVSGRFVAATDRNPALFNDLPSFDHSEYSQTVLMNTPIGLQLGNLKREYFGDISFNAGSEGAIQLTGDFTLAARKINLLNGNIKTGIMLETNDSQLPPNIIIAASEDLKVKDINAVGSQIFLLSGNSIDTTAGSIGIFTKDPIIDQLLSLGNPSGNSLDRQKKAQIMNNTSVFVHAKDNAKIGNITACCIQIISDQGSIDTTKGDIHSLTTSNYPNELTSSVQEKYDGFVGFIELSAAKDIRVNIVEANGKFLELDFLVSPPLSNSGLGVYSGDVDSLSSSKIDILEQKDSSASTLMVPSNSYASALQASITQLSIQRSLFLKSKTKSYDVPSLAAFDGPTINGIVIEKALTSVPSIPGFYSNHDTNSTVKEAFDAKSGNIYLKASNIEIVKGGRISSNPGYRSKPGSIFLEAFNEIKIEGRVEKSNIPSGIFSRVDGDLFESIEKYGLDYGYGYGRSYSGSISIKASNLVLNNSAEISVSSASRVEGSPDDRGLSRILCQG